MRSCRIAIISNGIRASEGDFRSAAPARKFLFRVAVSAFEVSSSWGSRIGVAYSVLLLRNLA